jgi:hypothetical protein
MITTKARAAPAAAVFLKFASVIVDASRSEFDLIIVLALLWASSDLDMRSFADPCLPGHLWLKTASSGKSFKERHLAADLISRQGRDRLLLRTFDASAVPISRSAGLRTL